MKFSQRLALSYNRTKFKLLSAISKKKAARKAFELFREPQRRHRKPLPEIFAEAENLHFSIEGATITGWRWNHPADKKVLIVHGFESSVTNFDDYIGLLIKKGYEVLAFDAPAHGRSGGKTITAPLYKDTIKEINKLYGPIDSFIAHSFGGLAVSLALEEIKHTDFTKLVLIAPATETEGAIDSFFKTIRLDDPLVREEFEKVIIKEAGVNSSWYSIRRAMNNIRAKTLWLHDHEDDTTPISDAIKVQQENHRNINFVFSTGLGHRRIYRDNKVQKAILDFL